MEETLGTLFVVPDLYGQGGGVVGKKRRKGTGLLDQDGVGRDPVVSGSSWVPGLTL